MQTKFCKNRRDIFSAPVRHSDEDIVQSNLAVTPSEMMKLAERGIPVTPQNNGLQYETGVPELEFTPPLEHMRGIDANDMWEARKDIKSRVRKAMDNAVVQTVD